MKRYTTIQSSLWKLANFDSFILGFCPTMYNTIAGIGLYFVLQLVIVFVSAITACDLWVTTACFLTIPFAIVISWLFFKWIKLNTRLQHEYNSAATLSVLFIINFILAFIILIPLCMLLLKGQIDFQTYLDDYKSESGFLGRLKRQAYGLFLVCTDENDGNMISFFSISLDLIVFFILFTPYVLIWNTLKSIHNIAFKTYEQKFQGPG